MRTTTLEWAMSGACVATIVASVACAVTRNDHRAAPAGPPHAVHVVSELRCPAAAIHVERTRGERLFVSCAELDDGYDLHGATAVLVPASQADRIVIHYEAGH